MIERKMPFAGQGFGISEQSLFNKYHALPTIISSYRMAKERAKHVPSRLSSHIKGLDGAVRED
ncbi:MAG: hypothetical protein ACSHXW_08265 [Yoonia sp.]